MAMYTRGALRDRLVILYGLLLLGMLGMAFLARLSNPHLQAAQEALKAHKTKEAVRQFDLALQGRPDIPYVYAKICEICNEFEQWTLMEQYARRGVQACKYTANAQDRAQLYNNLAGALGEIEPQPQLQAIDAAEHALRLDPRNDACLNSLGYLLADNNRDLPRAEAYLTEALRLVHQESQDKEHQLLGAMIMDSYGWLRYRQGRTLTAIDAFTQALNDVPDEFAGAPLMKVVYYHLGAAYRKAGQPEAARRALQAALQRDSGYGPARSELEQLERHSAVPEKALAPRPPAAKAGAVPPSSLPAPAR